MALALMRRHRRWLYVFLWLVIAAFIILYIPAFQDEPSGSPGETVVSVGPSAISVGEFQRAYYRLRQNYDRLYGGRLDEATRRQIQQQLLESLVTERVIELEAKRLGVTVSDEAVARAIATSAEFQDEGSFVGADEIRRRLELQGLTEEQLAVNVRRELLRERMEYLLGSATDVSDAEVQRELQSRNEQVRLEYVLVDAARFQAEVQPGEAEIEARFRTRKDAYHIPEKRVASYVLVDAETLRSFVAVDDHEIEVYYQDHREDFRKDEEACASHILIKVRQGESGEGHTDAAAQTTAQALLDLLNAGADFATLAKKSSEDPGSAQSGGDLGCFPPGRMVPEFDRAVFEMEPGQTSGLVKTSFGYHIIRLASKHESTVPPLQEVKERIRAVLLERKLVAIGEEKVQVLSKTLTDGKSLEEAARAAGLTVRKSTPFAKGEPPAELSSPTLVARVFALQAGEAERQPFALPQGAAFVALAEVQAAHVPQLQEVREKVRADLVREASFAKAQELASSVKARASKVGLEKAAAAASLLRKETPVLAGRGQSFGELGSGLALDESVFSLPDKTLSAPVRVSAGWAVLGIVERKSADPAQLAAETAETGNSLRAQRRSEIFEAFLRAAHERYSITRNPKAFARAVGEE